MMKLLRVALVALAFPAYAQTATPTAIVVATCGGASFGPAGRSAPLTVNTDGEECISGNIVASNPSVDATGGAVPADATYIAGNKAGTLTGLTLDGSSNLNVNVAAGSISATSAATATAADPSYSEGVSEDLSQDLSGHLRVGATQAGTWNVGITGGSVGLLAGSAIVGKVGIDQTTPGTTNLVQVTDGSGALNVIVDSSALPAGAATAAKQPALGTAGTASTDVITVQGIAAMTPIIVSDGAGALNVIVDSSALPTGAATESTLGGVLTSSNFAAAFGTAGSADSQVMSIQGIASMTPINVIVDSGTLTAVTSITNPVTVTDGAGALNVIVDSSALPSGAATEATLGGVLTSTNFANAFGTAGSADTQVMSVQGIASMTPLLANPGTAANWGVGATASAVPANAILGGYRSDGGLSAGTAALTAPVVCQDSVVISTATSGNVELVALTTDETIYVCGWDVVATGTVAVQLIYGTGSACTTGETNLTGAYPLVANGGLVHQSPFSITKTAVSNALCIELSAAVQVDGIVNYTKF